MSGITVNYICGISPDSSTKVKKQNSKESKLLDVTNYYTC